MSNRSPVTVYDEEVVFDVNGLREGMTYTFNYKDGERSLVRRGQTVYLRNKLGLIEKLKIRFQRALDEAYEHENKWRIPIRGFHSRSYFSEDWYLGDLNNEGVIETKGGDLDNEEIIISTENLKENLVYRLRNSMLGRMLAVKSNGKVTLYHQDI